jgi:DNA repair exonuclease SbcCD nuclease subunit
MRSWGNLKQNNGKRAKQAILPKCGKACANKKADGYAGNLFCDGTIAGKDRIMRFFTVFLVSRRPMRFLHAADLHIDSPLRGLADYEGAPVDRLRGATRVAFERLVDLAVAEQVDFVVLCGDIFDADWTSYNTGLFFAKGLSRLGRHGIRVFIVQGNHDSQGEITRYLDWPANTTVFSSRTAHTEQLDDLKVALHGRSFPNRQVTEDLASSYPAAVPGYFNIGLLHTSLNGRAGHDTYAPSSLAVLKAKGYQYWALGHVHARETVAESPWVVYPGNTQGRHANETGAKGCLLVEVNDEQTSVRFVPLDAVRWARVQISLDNLGVPADLYGALRRALEPALVEAENRLLACRVELTGAGPLVDLEAQFPGRLASTLQAAAQDLSEDGAWIEKVELMTQTRIDRQAVRERQDAAGELTRLVDDILARPDAARGWIDAALGNLPDPVGAVSPQAILQLTDLHALRALLHDAETTVLQQLLADAGSGARP